jgi:hypothetical protein
LGAWVVPGWPSADGDSFSDPAVTSTPVPCEVLACLKNSTNWFNNQGFSYGPVKGPNSNSFAAGVTAMCGVKGNVPWNAPGGGFFE